MFKTQDLVMEELVICDTAVLRILIEERSKASTLFLHTRLTKVILDKRQTNATSSVTMLYMRPAI